MSIHDPVTAKIESEQVGEALKMETPSTGLTKLEHVSTELLKAMLTTPNDWVIEDVLWISIKLARGLLETTEGLKEKAEKEELK